MLQLKHLLSLQLLVIMIFKCFNQSVADENLIENCFMHPQCNEIDKSNTHLTNCPKENPLEDQHLCILAIDVHFIIKTNIDSFCFIQRDLNILKICLKFPGALMSKRNASGHIIKIEGALPSMLQSLATLYKFRFTAMEMHVLD